VAAARVLDSLGISLVEKISRMYDFMWPYVDVSAAASLSVPLLSLAVTDAKLVTYYTSAKITP